MMLHFSILANHEIRHQAKHKSGLSAWRLLMATLMIFLRGLCGYEREMQFYKINDLPHDAQSVKGPWIL